WTSLVLVALALELAITATTTPVEVRVSRFSESVLTSHAHEAVAILDRGGPRKLARFLDELERTTRIHAVLLDPDGYDVSGRTVPPKPVAMVAARALASGQTEMEADGHTAVKARAGSARGRRTDEFMELGRDFDRMAERLDALVTAERRLLRDISHELRSPLARLNVALGLARQQGSEDQAVLDRIEREAERLNALIAQLLMLAWLESGTAAPARKPVDLADIVREVAEDAA